MTTTKSNRTAVSGSRIAPRRPARVARSSERAPDKGKPRDWRDRAACNDHDPEMWFSFDEETRQEAMFICRGCPVILECFSWAMEDRQAWGIWGGQEFDLAAKPWHARERERAERQTDPEHRTKVSVPERVEQALADGTPADRVPGELGYKSMDTLVDALRRTRRIDLIKRLRPDYRTMREIMDSANPQRDRRRKRIRNRSKKAKAAKADQENAA